ncbi:molybdopterin molybdotransferase MoeA [Novosphingobium sp. PASSN1]|uniref:molybdopterin molybdotransferase MoeA n=1 Tax=Novosphingobium sp. PASSN1 TaxID=2015561 RepID=UPI0025FFE7BF|nr:molybdopterin molybdotransferase MoeA [Novosphingobium sp. PASSN1]
MSEQTPAQTPLQTLARPNPPLALEEAQRRLMALAPVLPTEHRTTADCLGVYLAEPLTALRTQPAADVSAMDGYALRAADLPGPWRVIGESAAGRPFAGTVGPGEAARISTGALVPAGADMVLIQEDAARSGDVLTLTGTPPEPPHRHIRRAGLDFRNGDVLMQPGTKVGAAQIALALTAGHAHLPVRRPLELAVIDSGDELAGACANLAAHQLPASNSAMLAALASQPALRITRIGPVPDRLEALMAAFEAASDADVIVTSGGASVGDHDLIRPALAALGADLAFWRVAIKPGKPLLVARRGAQVILGLPGNPAAAFVTGFLFLLPLIRAALGAADPLPRRIPARLREAMPAGGSRMEFLRAVWDAGEVSLDGLQDSGALSSLARANALAVRPANEPETPAGQFVPVYLL